MNAKITRAYVERALRRHAVWDLGNDALYALCRKHPGHRAQSQLPAVLAATPVQPCRHAAWYVEPSCMIRSSSAS